MTWAPTGPPAHLPLFALTLLIYMGLWKDVLKGFLAWSHAAEAYRPDRWYGIWGLLWFASSLSLFILLCSNYPANGTTSWPSSASDILASGLAPDALLPGHTPLWRCSARPGHRNPFFKETDMDLQYEKQDESDRLLVKFCKFKFKAFAHYKVNQREQWCFRNTNWMGVCLTAAVFHQPQHPNHFPFRFHCSVSKNPASQREELANSQGLIRALHVLLGQHSVKVKKDQ